jgi:hypothetical protein
VFTRASFKSEILYNTLLLCGNEMIASASNPKLEDHPFSTVRDCLLVYSQMPSISGGLLLHPQLEADSAEWQRTQNFLNC